MAPQWMSALKYMLELFPKEVAPFSLVADAATALAHLKPGNIVKNI